MKKKKRANREKITCLLMLGLTLNLLHVFKEEVIISVYYYYYPCLFRLFILLVLSTTTNSSMSVPPTLLILVKFCIRASIRFYLQEKGLTEKESHY